MTSRFGAILPVALVVLALAACGADPAATPGAAPVTSTVEGAGDPPAARVSLAVARIG